MFLSSTEKVWLIATAFKKYRNGEAAYTRVQRGVDLFGRGGKAGTESP